MTHVITFKTLSGFGQDSRMINYVTFWSKDWETHSGVFFYPKTPDNIVDVNLSKDDALSVFTFPHNDTEKCRDLSVKFSEEIFEMAKNMKETSDTFTIVLENDGPRFLVADDFVDYYPNALVANSLFIFADDVTCGFPQIYCLAAVQKSKPHESLLSVLANSSHVCAKPAGTQTIFGKKLFYILSHSMSLKHFDSSVPAVDAVHFPTAIGNAVSPGLNLAGLRTLLNKAGVDKLRVKTTGITEVDIDAYDDVISLASIDSDEIIESVMDKGSITLTQLLSFGVKETLDLIGNSNVIIDIMADVGGLVRKACIFQQKLHYIVISNEDDVAGFLGEADADLLVQHTADTYPRHIAG
jgi:hypothetical protein